MDINAIKRFYNVNKLSIDEISKKIGFPKEKIEEVLFGKVEEVAEEVEAPVEAVVEAEAETVEEEVKEEAPVESPEEPIEEKGE